MKRICILALLLLALASPAWATTYYVAKTGGGTTCSMASPCLTIAVGLGKLAAGDTLIISNGTYTEAVDNIIPSGIDAAHPTIVRAENPVTTTWPNIVFNVTVNGNNSTPLGENVLVITHKHYVEIDDILFDGANQTADGKAVATIGGTQTQDAEGSTYITFNRVGFRNSHHFSCLVFRGMDPVVSEHITIYKGEVDHCGDVYPSNDAGQAGGGHGIYPHFKNSIVDGVYIHDIGTCASGCTTGYGIHQYSNYCCGESDNIFRNNVIRHTQTGGILVSYGARTQVYNNIIFDADVIGTGGAAGINIYDGSDDAELYNNTIYDGGARCIWDRSDPRAIIRNNLCVSNAINSIVDDSTHPPTPTINTNLLTTTNPFTNAAAYDFTLVAGSAPIDYGANLSTPVDEGFSTDINGTARPIGAAWDVGAYEAGTSGSGTCPATNFSSTFDGSEDPLSEGGCWTLIADSGAKKVSGLVQAKGLNEYTQIRWVPSTPLASDHYQTLILNLNTSPSAPWRFWTYIRWQANNGYYFNLNSDGSWALSRQDNGSGTILVSGTATWSSVETIRLQAIGSTISVLRGGATLASTTDASYTGSGKTVEFLPHVEGALTDVTVDYWEVGNATGGTVIVLTPLLSSIQQRPNSSTTTWTVAGSGGTVDMWYTFDSDVTRYAVANSVAADAGTFTFTPTWPAQTTMQMKICLTGTTTCGFSPAFITRGQYLK